MIADCHRRVRDREVIAGRGHEAGVNNHSGILRLVDKAPLFPTLSSGPNQVGDGNPY